MNARSVMLDIQLRQKRIVNFVLNLLPTAMNAKVPKHVQHALADISWWQANAKKKQAVLQQYG